jgi:hypothetical protein
MLALGKLGAGFGGLGAAQRGASQPRILLSGSSIAENSANGTVVGTATAYGTTGTPTWSLSADPDSKFTIDASTGVVTNDAAVDYETATSHSITISVSGTSPVLPDRTFNITVTDVSVTLANTVAPAVTGTEEVGQTLSCSTGTWTNSPSSYTYQWFRAITLGGSIVTSGGLFTGNAIGSATSATYLLDALDEGEFIYCEVTAHKAEAANVMAQSNATGAIAAAPSQTTALDPANKGSDIVLSEANITAANSVGSWESAFSTTSKTGNGLWYVEFKLRVVNDATHILLGIEKSPTLDGTTLITNANTGFYVRANGGVGNGVGMFTFNAANEPTYSGAANGVIGLAINNTTGNAWTAYNNTFGGSPAGGTNPCVTWTPDASVFYIAVSLFGASLEQVTIHTAASLQTYSPPAGFSTWD